MLVPLRLLVGSKRRWLLAVLLFVALDLVVLVTNLWIAHQVEQDAIAINLAGRQRMLSQRITKAALLAADTASPAPHDSAQELVEAYRLFDQTLRAFQQGGQVPGGDGQSVVLQAVRGAAGQTLLTQTAQLLQPVAEALAPLATLGNTPTTAPPDWLPVRDYLVRHNREVLAHMNRLTSVLESESVARIGTLRTVQIGAFTLALLNFIGIVWALLRQYHTVERERQHWHEAAQRDALTGLFNRRAFHLQLEQALQRAEQQQGTLGLFVIDLDNFKPINDTLGHATGDVVLQTFAQVLASVARDTDTVARLGGDEFAVLCPGMKDQHAVTDLCQRLFDGLLALPSAPLHPPVRASVGVALYPQHGTDARTLLHAADTAMYTSKEQGGQRCVMA